MLVLNGDDSYEYRLLETTVSPNQFVPIHESSQCHLNCKTHASKYAAEQLGF